LQKIATGWLKWKPDEFEYALIPDIMIAYEGHVDELKTIHGTGEEEKSNTTAVNTAEDFIAAFGNKGIKRQ